MGVRLIGELVDRELRSERKALTPCRGDGLGHVRSVAAVGDFAKAVA